MRIDWEHETFEGGLETWRTEFRGMVIVIRRGPDIAAGALQTEINAGPDTPMLYHRVEEILPGNAMTEALKFVNGYWDEIEDGPVVYQPMDVAPHLPQQPDRDGLPDFKDVSDGRTKRLPPEKEAALRELMDEEISPKHPDEGCA